jgi:D-sedoheptulose 7-phosphate isomerase
MRLDTLPRTGRDVIQGYLGGLTAVIEALPRPDIEALIAYLAEAYEQGDRIFVIGNGGSAATASHLACDLSKTVLGKKDRPQLKRFAVIALTDNMPLITAWANDVSYDRTFAEPLRNLARPRDRLIVITGSGNSPNVVEAARAARDLGLKTFGLLGFDGGAVKPLLDCAIVVNSENYGHIEDAHMILTHLVTAYFVKALEAA